MKITIDIPDKELKEGIIKWYANVLYQSEKENFFGLFGPKKDIENIIRKKAIELIDKQGKLDEYIKELIEDKNFIKNAVKEALKETADELYSDMKL